jgi:hypothetical protein
LPVKKTGHIARKSLAFPSPDIHLPIMPGPMIMMASQLRHDKRLATGIADD